MVLFLPILGAIAGVSKVAMSVADVIIANNKTKKLKDKLKTEKGIMQDLIDNRQEIKNPYADVTNQFANLPVATQAAKFQAEEADISLANTLDTLRATGAGAGGATALAQAALQSKRGISASLESQEAANQKLAAQGAMTIQAQKAEGEKWRWVQQESRDLMDLDRKQEEIDNLKLKKQESKAAMWGAIGNLPGDIIGAAAGFDNLGIGTKASNIGTNKFNDLLYGSQSMMAMNAFGVGNNPLD